MLEQEPREIHNNAKALYKSGKLRSAIELLEMLIDKHPKYLLAHNDLGVLYNEAGYPDKSEKCYLVALKLEPSFITAKLNLAELSFFVQGKTDRALKLLIEILSSDKNHMDALLLLGVICHKTGKDTDALTFLNRAIKIDPTNEQINNLLKIIDQNESTLDCMDKPKVWGIGLCRTGTTSLIDAFLKLGYRRVYNNPTFEELLVADAAADIGCTIYFKFLDYKFPGSKFILTHRDLENWLESVRFVLDNSKKISRKDNIPILRRMLLFETVEYNREKFINAYHRHYQDVRRYFTDRSGDLLEMDITAGDGWEQLCPFLGLEKPIQPFPHTNTRKESVKRDEVISIPGKVNRPKTSMLSDNPALKDLKESNSDYQVDPSKIVYSCVMDQSPIFVQQTQILVWTLINLAGVKPQQIILHVVKRRDKWNLQDFLYLGIRIREVIPFHTEYPHCNKLQQLCSPELQDAEMVILLDTDMAVRKDIAWVARSNIIRAKVVDHDNPPLDMLTKIFKQAQLSSRFKLVKTDPGNEPTISQNCNGGLYLIPNHHLKRLSNEWPKMVNWLIENVELLGDFKIHVDQVAFTMACHSLGYEIEHLPIELNYPLHLGNAPDCKPIVLHYHQLLDSHGLIKRSPLKNVDLIINETNSRIQKIRRNSFNNRVFWNYRYQTDSELGSGVGSRGDNLKYKRKILFKILNKQPKFSVLDVGCGDLEVTKTLKNRSYTGVDISDEAIKTASIKRPDWSFISGDIIEIDLPQSDIVVCFDVLIHQAAKDKYQDILKKIICSARKYLIISGYCQSPWLTSEITFFYEPLEESILNISPSAKIDVIGSYRDITILKVTFLDNSEEKSIVITNPNDIRQGELSEILSETKMKSTLLDCIDTSRRHFGWFTKCTSRTHEYPWVLDQIGHQIVNSSILDFGSGVSPLPLMLADRRAKIVTIDNHPVCHNKANIHKKNEWGFIDYSLFNPDIISINNSLLRSTFPPNSFDCIYSVSTIEHMPANSRRDVLDIFTKILTENGIIILTVDIIAGRKQLWLMSEGRQVEKIEKHGSWFDLLEELKSVNLNIIFNQIINNPRFGKIDVGLIVAQRSKN